MPLLHKCTSTFVLLTVLIFVYACSNEDINYTPTSGNTEITITHYSYGKMVIDEKTYEKDLAILPSGKIGDWSFDYTYHKISPEDLGRYISEDVKTIIIGRGYERIASLSESAEEMIKSLKSKGVEVHYLLIDQYISEIIKQSMSSLAEVTFISISYH
ncbi:MAG: MTH938/NDUFAF3 family protein [Pseudomonadota bacterium]